MAEIRPIALAVVMDGDRLLVFDILDDPAAWPIDDALVTALRDLQRR